MLIADLLELGFRDSSECPPAWQDKGRVVCRHFDKALISVLWYSDSSEIEVLVGPVHSPLLHFRSSLLTLANLQALLRDYWSAA
ncbi:hypothetical protein [Hymenobacter glacieicola]|uniref:DUF5659 domain-containing protein n=1 Tax=Hymenobacter glacieicola TaxID=1562124 RepID=A0ABQ1WYY5_9BACT|nr:hypothetical protein [Hymenobacter glacieicola]GGG51701.1 hypothetical protein GCM10011378_29890 [Hymenobacter glacieicola]